MPWRAETVIVIASDADDQAEIITIEGFPELRAGSIVAFNGDVMVGSSASPFIPSVGA